MLTTYRVYSVLFLAGAAICGGCQKTTNPGVEIENEGARRGREAYRIYKTADYPTAKAGLLDFAQWLDKASSDPNAADAVRDDATLSYVRLAKLEEKQGHTAEQAAYMKQAVARCQSKKQQLGGCAEERLRRITDQVDQVPPN